MVNHAVILSNGNVDDCLCRLNTISDVLQNAYLGTARLDRLLRVKTELVVL